MSELKCPPISPLSYEIDEHGVCRLHPLDDLAPEAIDMVAQFVRSHLSQGGTLPTGLVLDVRNFPQLSAVRLASLIDVLSETNLRLAVLFSDERQLHIATLIHNTLAHKELIAYFVDFQAARTFVLDHPTTPDAPPPHTHNSGTSMQSMT